MNYLTFGEWLCVIWIGIVLGALIWALVVSLTNDNKGV